MSKQLTILLLSAFLFASGHTYAYSAWQKVQSRQIPGSSAPVSAAYPVYSADEAQLKAQLALQAKGAATVTELPMADGRMVSFIVSRNTLLPQQLMQHYPGLATYTAVAADDPKITAVLDFTVYGFHAMIFDGANISFIDPANDLHDGYYTVHYKKDEVRGEERRLSCAVHGDIADMHNTAIARNAVKKTTAVYNRVTNGDTLRSYRLAISCDHQYAQAVTALPNPSRAEVLSKMVTTMNRVNGVFERELSVTMVFIPNEDTLLFLDASTDPFGTHNDDPVAMLGINQVICDSFIGSGGYDIGHIFSTGGGGLSQLGVVCTNGMKAQSVTGSATPVGDGFDIDYVVHEMGHEFGSNHTFNDNANGSCAGNAVADYAYEPGSGSTIMCYAGICGPDNVQAHSDAYFCGSSLEQMQFYINTGGDGCAVKTPANNEVAVLPAFSAQYTIPFQTPFELTAPAAVVPAQDTLTTYCWEQWDLGDFGATLSNTHIRGPIFRSFSPVTSTTRVFPEMRMVLAGTLSNAGVNNASGEKAPDVARQLSFRLTVRNIYNGHGCFLLPADTVGLFVINSGTGFKVTSQATDGIVYSGNTSQQLTWDVAGTNNAPVKAATVDVYMSADSGRTWTFHVGTVPNTGSANIVIPNPDTSIPAARFKVKGTNNVFFNVNSKYFRVNRNLESAIKLFPIPAHDVLHITTENAGALDVAVFNAIGRCEWKGTVTGQADLPAYLWARGIYLVKIVDASGRRVVRKIIVE